MSAADDKTRRAYAWLELAKAAIRGYGPPEVDEDDDDDDPVDNVTDYAVQVADEMLDEYEGRFGRPPEKVGNKRGRKQKQEE